MMKLNNQEKGFTIVELLLSMAFFSFILVFFTFGFIQVNRTFQKGITIKAVTETGRLAVEDIARNIRLSEPINFTSDSLSINDGDSVNRLCIGNVHYGWNLASDTSPELLEDSAGSPVGGPPYFTLVKSELNRGSCNDSFRLTDEPQQVTIGEDVFFTTGITSLVEEGILVEALDIQPVLNDSAVRIDLILYAGEDDLVNRDSGLVECNGYVQIGDQFCDVVRFSTTVNFRLP